MKSCPTCKRTFEDTLTYCLVDGSILSAPFDPQATLLIPQQNPTVPMTNPAAYPPAKSNKLLWIVVASVALIAAGTIIVIALINRQSGSGEVAANTSQQNKAQTSEANTGNRNSSSPSPSNTPAENKNTGNVNAFPGGGTANEDLESLQKYAGQYAGDMFKKEAGLRQRLKTLLGSNYQLFMDRWDVTAPIEDDVGILFAEGCMAHACTSEESLIAIDTSRGIIYCAILSDSFGGKFKTYSEGNGGLPAVMRDRMQELMSMK